MNKKVFIILLIATLSYSSFSQRLTFVGGEFAVPTGADFLVPYALEIGGLGAGPGTADEQIACKLKVEGSELRIVCTGGKGLAA